MGKSFLQKLIDSFKDYHTIRVGKESILIETKDLFINAYYNYIKSRFTDFKTGIDTLKEYNLDKKDSIQIVKHTDNSYSLRIQYKNGEKQIHNIEKLFEDSEGHYNVKGYYDENTVEKFNTIIYQVFDEIINS